MTYKQKIALLKNEKAKYKNLSECHQWKLKNDFGQIDLGANTAIPTTEHPKTKLGKQTLSKNTPQIQEQPHLQVLLL